MAFSLPLDCPIPWTMTQERNLRRDYPLLPGVEDPLQQRVVHVYLQYLWLPESLMPLRMLAPALMHLVQTQEDSTQPHPLHAMLDPLLHTVRSCATKYRSDLPALIGANGEEPPEAEESMIWLALRAEPAIVRDAGSSQNPEPARTRWLAHMEHREVQIQILLYLLKLSLPGLTPEVHKSLQKRRGRKASPPPAPPEQRLESFMDKLAMWQLLSDSIQLPNSSKQDEPDWVQKFCTQVVEPSFKSILPEQCQILRDKVFSHSVFSDGEHSNNEPDTAPTIKARKRPRAGSSVSTTSRARSLSISLAEERRTLARSGSIGAGAGKRILSREVSMSRVFKDRERSAPPKDVVSAPRAKPNAEEERKRKKAAQAREKEGRTLVKATPAKGAGRIGIKPGANIGEESEDESEYGLGRMLVAATPTKQKAR